MRSVTVIVLLPFVVAAPAGAQETRPVTSPAPQSQPLATQPCPDIAPFFAPPPEFRGQLGAYRSPLRFNDGALVRTPADWQRRRQEILDYWHSVMGPWPALIDHPTIQYLSKEHAGNFTRCKVRVEVAPDDRREAYLLIPDGQGPFPAVLVTWYDPASSAGLGRNPNSTVAFGSDLAGRGFVTLCIGDDIRSRGREPLPNNLQPISYLAYCAANCANLLADLPQVDAARIGVVGHSFGGKWALFASCLCERFACAAWSDPGIVWNEADPNANWWEPWYLGCEPQRVRPKGLVTQENPRTGAYRRLIAEGRDLHELHALMAPRPFLVSGGAQDMPEHWIALNHTIAVNNLLGFKDRVAMTNRQGHNPTTESNQQMYRFFECFLRPPR